MMPQVAITKVNSPEKKTLPVFAEIARRLDAVQRRAFDRFEKRGGESGHELDDWFEAERELFGRVGADLAENDSAYEIKLALPGFDPKEIEVTATPKQVIVHAAIQKQEKTKKDGILRTESGSEDIYRQFDLPVAINVDQVTARVDNGTLQINAPKAAKAEAKCAAA
jgi:HSP20 family molecular chaperone IbpA